MPAKERIGTVVSNKMQKTIVVAVQSRYQSYLYSKFKIRISINTVFYFFLINNSLLTKVIIMLNFYKDLLYNFKKIKILFIK